MENLSPMEVIDDSESENRGNKTLKKKNSKIASRFKKTEQGS